MIALEAAGQNRCGFGDLRTITFVQFISHDEGEIIRSFLRAPIKMRTPQPSPKEYTDDEIDLRQLITVLWQQKALIAGVVVVGALLGVGSSLNSTRYVTEGLFLTPGVLASDYKRYENVVSNGARLQQYLQHTDQARTSEGQLIFKLGDDHDRLAETLKPEFAFTEHDSKTYGVKVNGDDSGALIGVRMRFSDTNPTGGTPIGRLEKPPPRPPLVKLRRPEPRSLHR